MLPGGDGIHRAAEFALRGDGSAAFAAVFAGLVDAVLLLFFGHDCALKFWLQKHERRST